jgi:hypothetical protein
VKSDEFRNLKKAILSEALKSVNEQVYKCFVRDCCEPAINSHSQSKGCSLKHISIYSKVISLRPKLFSYVFSHDKSLFNEEHINQASTFRGFCQKHDNEYFNLVDNLNSANLTKEALFRLAFRTFAMEVRTKELMRSSLSFVIRKSIGIFTSEIIEMTYLVKGIDIFLKKDYPYYLQKFESGFGQNLYDDTESVVFIIDRNIGLSTSSVITPFCVTSSEEYCAEWNGLDFQPALFFTVLPKERETIVIFTYFMNDKELAKDFIKRNKKLEDIVFNYCEEVLLSPSLFNSLRVSTRTKIIKGLKPWYDWQKVKFPDIFNASLTWPQYY